MSHFRIPLVTTALCALFVSAAATFAKANDYAYGSGVFPVDRDLAAMAGRGLGNETGDPARIRSGHYLTTSPEVESQRHLFSQPIFYAAYPLSYDTYYGGDGPFFGGYGAGFDSFGYGGYGYGGYGGFGFGGFGGPFFGRFHGHPFGLNNGAYGGRFFGGRGFGRFRGGFHW